MPLPSIGSRVRLLHHVYAYDVDHTRLGSQVYALEPGECGEVDGVSDVHGMPVLKVRFAGELVARVRAKGMHPKMLSRVMCARVDRWEYK